MTAYQFWRPVLFSAAICCATLFACRYLMHLPTHGEFEQSAVLSLDFPNPSLEPGEVVSLQMKGLMDRADAGLGALQCYCFAAPANRLVTGPFRRFAQMVRAPPWDRLGACKSFTIGKPQVIDNEARVLVSTVGEDRKLQVYAFLLKRQTGSPFHNCWMTAGVFVIFTQSDLPRPESDKELRTANSTNMLY